MGSMGGYTSAPGLDVGFDGDAGVLTSTLNKPAKRNAIDDVMTAKRPAGSRDGRTRSD